MIPLNETSGIIEWVDNLTSLRSIIGRLMKERPDAKPMKPREYSDFETRIDDPAGNQVRKPRRLLDLNIILPTVYALLCW